MNWWHKRFFSKIIFIPGAPKKIFFKRCTHIFLHTGLHNQPIMHAPCFSSQIHPSASIGTIGIKFEAVSPYILNTPLNSFFFKWNFFITFLVILINFPWCRIIIIIYMHYHIFCAFVTGFRLKIGAKLNELHVFL